MTLLQEIQESPSTQNVTFQLEEIFNAVTGWILQDYNIVMESLDTEGVYRASLTFHLVFQYFFIAVGATLMMLAVLLLLGKDDKTVGEYSAALLRCVAGAGMCLPVVLDSIPGSALDFGAYSDSPWILPTVLLGFALGEYPSTVSALIHKA